LELTCSQPVVVFGEERSLLWAFWIAKRNSYNVVFVRNSDDTALGTTETDGCSLI